jgi:pantoate--beta-alanine ligase
MSGGRRDSGFDSGLDPGRDPGRDSGFDSGRDSGLVVRTREELAAARGRLPGPVGLVMTMGALHAGHVGLVRAVRERAASVIVTVFVNPLQFGPNEDLEAYPRTLADDARICADEGVDLVFAPDVATVYPQGPPAVRVHAGPLGEVLEGRSRPGHFDGVLTVVAKFLHLTRPDVAAFGCKDAQQLILVRRMVADLDLPVEVLAVPTVRDPDGLACSSRNVYLDPAQRRAARALPEALRAAEAAAAGGPGPARRAALAVLAAEPAVQIDYLALVDPTDLTDVPDLFTGRALLAVAARVGSTRLIDNVLLTVGSTAGSAEAGPGR